MAAEVSEQRGVEGPADCCDGVEEHEQPPGVSERAGAESDDGASARDEAGDCDQLPSALPHLLLSPLGALSSLLATQEALFDPAAETRPDEIRGVVAEERSRGGSGNDRRQAQV